MSMHICNESSHTHSLDYVKCFVVDKQQLESLADYVRRVRNEKDFSLSKVERNSGGEIDSSYVSRVENGLIKNVSPEKLRALAKGLDVSEDEIFDVARGVTAAEPSSLEQEIGVMFYGWNDATDEDKKATIEAIKMIAEGFQRRRTRKKK